MFGATSIETSDLPLSPLGGVTLIQLSEQVVYQSASESMVTVYADAVFSYFNESSEDLISAGACFIDIVRFLLP